MCRNNFQMSWNSRFLVLNKTAWYDQKCAQWRICQIFTTFAIFAIFIKIATFQGAPVKISLNFRLIFGKFSAQSPFSPKLPLFKGPLRTSLNFLQTFGEFSPNFPFSLLRTFLNIWLHVSRGTAFLSKAKIQLFCILTFGWPTWCPRLIIFFLFLLQTGKVVRRWTSYFDYVGVDARKPLFFGEGTKRIWPIQCITISRACK